MSYAVQVGYEDFYEFNGYNQGYTFAVAPAGPADPFENIADYWPLEESGEPWLDVIGDPNDIVYNHSFPVPVQVPGKNNFGLRMVPGSISILMSSVPYDWTGPFSLSFWVKPEVPAIILDNSAATVYFGWGTPTADRFSLNLNFAGQVAGSQTALAGVWNHVVITSDGATTKVYVNGVLDLTIPDAPTTLSEVFRMYNGSFDEIGSYPVEIPLAQVEALYNNGDGVFIQPR